MWGIVRLWGKREAIVVVLYHSLDPLTLEVMHVLKVGPFIMFLFIALPPDFELESPAEPPGIDKLLNGELVFIIDLHRRLGDRWLSRDRVWLHFGQQVDMEDVVDPPLVRKSNMISHRQDLLNDREGSSALSTKLLGRGIGGEVPGVKPHIVTNIESRVLTSMHVSEVLLVGLGTIKFQLSHGLDMADFLEAFGHVHSLTEGGPIHVYWVIAIIGIEWQGTE